MYIYTYVYLYISLYIYGDARRTTWFTMCKLAFNPASKKNLDSWFWTVFGCRIKCVKNTPTSKNMFEVYDDNRCRSANIHNIQIYLQIYILYIVMYMCIIIYIYGDAMRKCWSTMCKLAFSPASKKNLDFLYLNCFWLPG